MGFSTSFSKSLSKPTRTSGVGTYGAPKGVNGVATTKPFENAINQFGTTARKGLKGLTTVRKYR